ncbi:MAG: flagellar hook capping FlgD N-terminal domain-containing protein [Acidobacteriota bacterium]
MTAAAAGIWNHAAPESGRVTAKPQSGAAGSGSGDPSTTSATISANDFLTLLVTELQNQDPTAQTDPNEYVNQLVSVNSLEQLIQINQTLNAATGSGGGGGTPGAVSNPGAGRATQSASPAPQASAGMQNSTALAPGNLAIPHAQPAAQRVAQALSGRAR